MSRRSIGSDRRSTQKERQVAWLSLFAIGCSTVGLSAKAQDASGTLAAGGDAAAVSVAPPVPVDPSAAPSVTIAPPVVIEPVALPATVMPAPVQTAATSLFPGNSALDLSSTVANIASPLTQAVQIQIGGSLTNGVVQGGDLLTINPGQAATAAQLLAAQQVAAGGVQNLLIGQSGSALGGYASLTPAHVDQLSSLNIPQNVFLSSLGFTPADPFVVSGSSIISGTIFAGHDTPGLTSAFNLGSLNVSAGALFTGDLPGALLNTSFLQNVFPSAALNITVLNDVINSGTISAPALAINAGGSILNNSIAGMPQATMMAQNLSLNSAVGNIVNSGLISATAGNINLASTLTQNLLINNVGGAIEALQGQINVRDSSFSQLANTAITGGDLLAKGINLFSGEGTIDLSVNGLTGVLTTTANAVHVDASTPLLALGCVNAADPIFVNRIGGIDIQGDFSNITESLTILANGSITSSGVVPYTLTAGGQGITMIAGATITGGGNQTSVIPGTAGSANVTQVTAGPGGSIDFSANAVNLNPSGGAVTLAAFRNTATGAGGEIKYNGSISSASTVDIIGGTNTGTVQTGAISATGAVNVRAAQPSITGTLAYNVSGARTSGTLGAGATTNGLLDVTGNVTSSTSITLTNGSLGMQETAGTLTAPAVTFSSTGSVGNSVTPISINAGTGASQGVTANGTGGVFLTDTAGGINIAGSSGASGNNTTWSLATLADGDINVNAAVTANAGTTGTISLNAGGAGKITQGGGSLTADQLNLTSGTGDIGASGSPLSINAGASTGDGVAANTGGSVFLNDTSAGTNIRAASTAGTDKTWQLTTSATGPIAVNANVTVGGNDGTINLTAGTSGAITSNGSGRLTADHINLTSASGNIGTAALPILTDADTGAGEGLGANTSGNVFLSDSGAVNVFNSTASGASSTFSLTAAGNINNSGGNSITSNLILLNSTAGSIGIDASTPLTINAGTGATQGVRATATGNVFLQDSTGGVRIATNSASSAGTDSTWSLATLNDGGITISNTVTAAGNNGTINLSADGTGTIVSGGATNRLTADRINLKSGSGNIGASGAAILTNADTGSGEGLGANTTGNVFLSDNGSINVYNSTAGGTFSLAAAGSINNAASGDSVSAPLVILSASAGSIGTSAAAPFVINANSAATEGVQANATAGSVFLQDTTGGVRIATSAASGAANNNTWQLDTLSGGDIIINNNVTLAGTGAGSINLTADGAGTITRASGTLSAASGNVTLNAASIGASGAAIQVNAAATATTGLQAVATAGSSYVTDTTGGVSLRNGAPSSAAADQTFELSTLANGAININSDVSLTGDNGTINLTVNGSGTINSNGTARLTADRINLASTSGAIGTSGAPILTNSDTGSGEGLGANTSGSVFLSDSGPVNVYNSTASGTNSTFSLTAAGNINNVAGASVTADLITLNSTAGSVGTDSSTPMVINTNTGATQGVRAVASGSVFLQDTTGGARIATSGASSAGADQTWQLVTLADGAIGISNDVNVSGDNGTINLSANGSGAITRAAGRLTADRINLTSGSGNIGASAAAPIQTNADTGPGEGLGANTTGSVFLSDSGAVNIYNSTAGGTFSVAAAGSINNAAAGNSITAPLVILSASAGSIGTTSAAPLVFNANAGAAEGIQASATAGSVFLQDTAGGVRIATSGASGAANNNTWQLETLSDGNIIVNNSVTMGGAGAGNINLTANGTGTITRASGTLSASTGNVTLNAASIGAPGASVQVNAGVAAGTGLQAVATTGSAYVIDTTGGVNLRAGASSSVGADQIFDLSTLANGAININSDLTVSGNNGTINLTTNGSGAITSNGSARLTADRINLASTSGAIGTSALPILTNSDIGTAEGLGANTTGNVFLSDSGPVNLYNSTATNSTFSLTAAGNINNAAPGDSVTANLIVLNSTAGSIGTSSGTPMVINANTGATQGVQATATGSVFLQDTTGGARIATSGASSAGADQTWQLETLINGPITISNNVTVTGNNGTINLTAAGSGAITRSAGTLTADRINLSSGSGNIGASGAAVLTNADTGTGEGVGATTTGSVFLSDSGSVNIYNSSAGGTFSLTAAGNVNNSAAGNSITAPNIILSATAGSLGTSTAAPLVINAGSGAGEGVQASSTTGSVFLQDTTGGVNISGASSVSGNNQTWQLVTLDNGNIGVNANVTATAGTTGTAVLTAGGSGNITNGGGRISADRVDLSSTSGDIGASSSALLIAGSSTSAGDGVGANTAGNVYLSELDSVFLKASTGSVFSLTAAGSITTQGVVSASDTLTLTTTAGNGAITLGANASGVNGATLTTQGTGDIILNAGVSLSTANSPITLTADDLQYDLAGAATSINAGTSSVAVLPNGAKSIGLGTGSGNTLNLSNTELARIVANSLTVGDASLAGGINVTANISFSDGLALNNAGTVTLQNNSRVATTSATGTTSINAGDLSMLGNSTIQASSAGGTVVLASVGNRTMGIGGAAGGAQFDVSATELANISASNLVIGSRLTSGSVTVRGDVSTFPSSITINTSDSITRTGGTLISSDVFLNAINDIGTGTANRIFTQSDNLVARSDNGSAFIYEVDDVDLSSLSQVLNTFDLLADGSITNNNFVPNIVAQDVVLESTNGSIGTQANPVVIANVAIPFVPGTLTANANSASGNVFIQLSDAGVGGAITSFGPSGAGDQFDISLYNSVLLPAPLVSAFIDSNITAGSISVQASDIDIADGVALTAQGNLTLVGNDCLCIGDNVTMSAGSAGRNGSVLLSTVGSSIVPADITLGDNLSITSLGGFLAGGVQAAGSIGIDAGGSLSAGELPSTIFNIGSLSFTANGGDVWLSATGDITLVGSGAMTSTFVLDPNGGTRPVSGGTVPNYVGGRFGIFADNVSGASLPALLDAAVSQRPTYQPNGTQTTNTFIPSPPANSAYYFVSALDAANVFANTFVIDGGTVFVDPPTMSGFTVTVTGPPVTLTPVVAPGGPGPGGPVPGGTAAPTTTPSTTTTLANQLTQNDKSNNAIYADESAFFGAPFRFNPLALATDKNSFIISTSQCQPFFFEQEDGSIILAQSGTMFGAPSQGRLVLTTGRMLAGAGGGKLAVVTDLGTVTIEANAAALLDYNPSQGVLRVANLGTTALTLSVSSPQSTTYSVGRGEELLIAKDGASSEQLFADDSIPRTGLPLNGETPIGVTAVRNRFDTQALWKEEPLLSCDLGGATERMRRTFSLIKQNLVAGSPAGNGNGGRNNTGSPSSSSPALVQPTAFSSPANEEGDGVFHAEQSSNATEGSQVAGKASVHGIVAPIAVAAETKSLDSIKTLSTNTATIKVSALPAITVEKDDVIALGGGETLVHARKQTHVRADGTIISIKAGAVALVSVGDGCVKVRNLFENGGNSVELYTGKTVIKVSAGQEVMHSADGFAVTRELKVDPVGRRRIRNVQIGDGQSITRSEFSIVSLFGVNSLMAQLRKSPEGHARELTEKIIKMAACLTVATASHGPYSNLAR